jgi:hypothetical protein
MANNVLHKWPFHIKFHLPELHRLTGAATGLENRNSMGYELFFHTFCKNLRNEFKGLFLPDREDPSESPVGRNGCGFGWNILIV